MQRSAGRPQRRASDKVARRDARQRWLWAGLAALALGGLAAVLLWPLMDAGAVDSAPNWSADSRRLAFVVNRASGGDVYVMNADGSGRRAVVATAADERAPAFAPDGTRIAFETDRDGDVEIYVVRDDGGELQRLTNHRGPDRAPAWSPDGRRIAFVSERDAAPGPSVYMMNVDGTGVAFVASTRADGLPQFSPDGRHLAFETGNNLRIVDLTAPFAAGVSSATPGAGPTWSPSGDTIAFATTRHGRGEIFAMRPDTSAERALVSISGGAVARPRWSPDGTRLAFEHRPVAGLPGRDGLAIYSFELSSGKVTRLSP